MVKDAKEKIIEAMIRLRDFKATAFQIPRWKIDWLGMGEIRDESGLSRELFDKAMIELSCERVLTLIPESNQKMLTRADWHNAVIMGGQHKHCAGINRWIDDWNNGTE